MTDVGRSGYPDRVIAGPIVDLRQLSENEWVVADPPHGWVVYRSERLEDECQWFRELLGALSTLGAILAWCAVLALIGG